MHRWEYNVRMDLKEIGIGLIRLRIGIIESPCEFDIERPRSIGHGVS